MGDETVLLVLVGALGDLAWRKFIQHARDLEMAHTNVNVLLVDVSWKQATLSLEDELRLRIGRRLIEVHADELNAAYFKGLRESFSSQARQAMPVPPPRKLLVSDLGATPLPWEVEKFITECLDPEAGDVDAEKKKLTKDLDAGTEWFLGHGRLGLKRYTSDAKQLFGSITELKAQGSKVVVFLATPPEYYPSLVDQWNGIADRIVFEKPAAGLDPQTLEYTGTHNLREAARRVVPSSQCVSSDHYNAKLITRVLDRIRDYHLFDHLLDPRRISRIVVELLENAPLPLGRSNFYNGAGGAFGDMVPHLFQAIRALLGVTTGKLKIRFGNQLYRAQYRNAPLEGEYKVPDDPCYQYEPGYFRPLKAETETFVAFEAELEVDGTIIPVYCRTGKGFAPERKSLRVDCRYDDTGSEVSLMFNFKDKTIAVRDDSNEFEMITGELILNAPFQSGVPGLEPEYRGIFECLVKSDWGPTALDTRYFPSVSDAADMADNAFNHLVAKRRESPMHYYNAGDQPSQREILSFLAPQASW
jgi:glucose-6-phosphate 1-dehydrogenase